MMAIVFKKWNNYDNYSPPHTQFTCVMVVGAVLLWLFYKTKKDTDSNGELHSPHMFQIHRHKNLIKVWQKKQLTFISDCLFCSTGFTIRDQSDNTNTQVTLVNYLSLLSPHQVLQQLLLQCWILGLHIPDINVVTFCSKVKTSFDCVN